jgi:hypothetical protein
MVQMPVLPDVIARRVLDTYGPPVAVERLGGMSLARVFRLHVQGGSVIVKTSPKPAESLFYERVAGRLRDDGVPIPRLEWSTHLPDSHWIAIEDLPLPLAVPPPERWRPDPRVLSVLARLHRATRDWGADVHPSPTVTWTDTATEAAAGCFPGAVAVEQAAVLRQLQEEARHLRTGWCWIAGDASPPNWGVRHDGSVALFDWELFRPGMPAVDLATTVPGLGEPPAYRHTADAYLAAARAAALTVPWSADQLARDIALAKVATVVLLLQAHATGAARVPADVIDRLTATVPEWSRGLVARPPGT